MDRTLAGRGEPVGSGRKGHRQVPVNRYRCHAEAMVSAVMVGGRPVSAFN